MLHGTCTRDAVANVETSFAERCNTITHRAEIYNPTCGFSEVDLMDFNEADSQFKMYRIAARDFERETGSVNG